MPVCIIYRDSLGPHSQPPQKIRTIALVHSLLGAPRDIKNSDIWSRKPRQRERLEYLDLDHCTLPHQTSRCTKYQTTQDE